MPTISYNLPNPRPPTSTPNSKTKASGGAPIPVSLFEIGHSTTRAARPETWAHLGRRKRFVVSGGVS